MVYAMFSICTDLEVGDVFLGDTCYSLKDQLQCPGDDAFFCFWCNLLGWQSCTHCVCLSWSCLAIRKHLWQKYRYVIIQWRDQMMRCGNSVEVSSSINIKNRWDLHYHSVRKGRHKWKILIFDLSMPFQFCRPAGFSSKMNYWHFGGGHGK